MLVFFFKSIDTKKQRCGVVAMQSVGCGDCREGPVSEAWDCFALDSFSYYYSPGSRPGFPGARCVVVCQWVCYSTAPLPGVSLYHAMQAIPWGRVVVLNVKGVWGVGLSSIRGLGGL